MEQFIVSARKYRPNTFDSLIGQENIATTLRNSIIRGQLSHAYLFCGPRGVGKTSMARIFAKSINCLNPSPDMEPCGQCESCLSFAEGRSYSIHELDAASNNSVDDIRNIIEMVRIPPQIGKYSVYIIDEVHMLSSSAFNAFLKTLEEPPAHAIFILATTEKHKILPTILSRCQTYDFNRISIMDIIKNLRGIASKEGISIDEDALHIIAQKADGAMRDALTLFDQMVAFCGKEISYEQVISNLNVLDYEYYFRLVDMFLKGDYTGALLTFDEILSKGFNALHFISGLSSHFRDLLVCSKQASESLLELPPSLLARYKEQAASCSVSFIFTALGITTACEAAYKQSGNQRLLIEFGLMRLANAGGAAMGGAGAIGGAAGARAAGAVGVGATGATGGSAGGAGAAGSVSAVASGSAGGARAVSQDIARGAAGVGASAGAGRGADNGAMRGSAGVAGSVAGTAGTVKAAGSVANGPMGVGEAGEADVAGVARTANAVNGDVTKSETIAGGGKNNIAEGSERNTIAESEKTDNIAGGGGKNAIAGGEATNPAAGKSMSLKEMMQNAEKTSTKSVSSTQRAEDKEFDAEAFMDIWKELIDKEKNEGRKVLAATLAQYTPDIEDDKIFFFVSNEAQRKWVEEKCLAKMNNFVRERLQNQKVTLWVKVAPTPDGEPSNEMLTPTQKAERMLKNSEELRELKKNLELDLK